MGILDYSQSNPWLGDALATLSQGLLAYGSGNQNAMAQLPLLLQQRQQDRRTSARQARADERDQKLFELKLQEQERTANQDAAQKRAAMGLLGGPAAPNGMSQAQFGGAPTAGSPLGGFDQPTQNYIKTLVNSGDYGSAIDTYGKLVTEKPEGTDLKDNFMNVGGSLIDLRDPTKPIYREPDKPQAPREDPLVEVWDGTKMIYLPRSQAAGKQSEAPSMPDPADVLDNTSKVNSMAKPYIDSAINMSKQVQQINTALAQQNGTGDIAAIIAFNKLLDEGAVVRESDVALTVSAQSVLDQMRAWQANARKGDIMPQELRDKLKATTQAFYDAGNKYSKARIEGFKSLAEPSGVDWGNIVSPGLEQMLWGAPAAPAPDAGGYRNGTRDIPQPKSQAERDALAPGTTYLDPKGNRRVKQ